MRNTFDELVANRRGDVAALFGIMALCLFLMIGGAIDYGRWLHARHQTISAMDAAVLAAGRSLQIDAIDKDGAIAAAEAFYRMNVKSRLGLENDTINFSVTDDGLSVVAAGNAFISTPFLSLANIERLPILDEAGSDYSKSEIAAGGNAETNIELSIMLDVTGSMAGDKIADLKIAAKDLIDIVVWDDQSQHQSRVALVPFSEGVRVPSSALEVVRGTAPELITKLTSQWHWYWGWTMANVDHLRTDCLAERTGPQAFTDAAPENGSYVTPVYTTDTGRNCNPNSDNVIVPLSADKAALKQAVDNLTTNGGTAGQLGTAWSWYTLSPKWNSVWPDSSSAASEYGAADTQKIAILMTDGNYNTQYSVDGIKVGESDSENGASTSQARTICTAMKEEGITVYTVGFGLAAGSSADDTMAQCATDPSKAFTAVDGDDLKQAFRAIALEVSKLYLSS